MNKTEFESAIAGMDEIGVIDKGDVTVYQYNVAFPDTFKNPAAKECRGRVYDNETGEIVRNTFAKFFNVNEKEETQFDLIKDEKILWVTNKLDGTLISPLIRNDNIFWGTKRLADDFNDAVWKFLSEMSPIESKQYVDFVWNCVLENITPMFEFHDPKCSGSVIVIHYDRPFLRLIGLRDNVTDELFYVRDHPLVFAFPLIEAVEHLTITSLEDIEQFLSTAEGIEGRVVMLEKTGIVKMKSPWYVKRHRVKSLFEFDHIKAQLILEKHELSMDDIAPNMEQTDREELERFGVDLKGHIEKVKEYIIDESNKFEDRKSYGLHIQNHPDVFSGLIFPLINNGKDNAYNSVVKSLDYFIKKDARFKQWGELVDKI